MESSGKCYEGKKQDEKAESDLGCAILDRWALWTNDIWTKTWIKLGRAMQICKKKLCRQRTSSAMALRQEYASITWTIAERLLWWDWGGQRGIRGVFNNKLQELIKVTDVG